MRSYYLLQYERVGQEENQRLQFSSFVIAAPVVALGVLTTTSPNLSKTLLGVPLGAVFFANLIAIVHARRSRSWVKFHQQRARKVLDKISPTSADMEQNESKPGSDKSIFRFSYCTHIFTELSES